MIFENINILEFSSYIIENKATIKKTCEHFNITEYKYRKIKKYIQENDYNNYLLIQNTAKNNKSNNVQKFNDVEQKTFVSEFIENAKQFIDDMNIVNNIFKKYEDNNQFNILLCNKAESVIECVNQIMVHEPEMDLESDIDCCTYKEVFKSIRNDRRIIKDTYSILDTLNDLFEIEDFNLLRKRINYVNRENRSYAVKSNYYETKEYINSLKIFNNNDMDLLFRNETKDIKEDVETNSETKDMKEIYIDKKIKIKYKAKSLKENKIYYFGDVSKIIVHINGQNNMIGKINNAINDNLDYFGYNWSRI